MSETNKPNFGQGYRMVFSVKAIREWPVAARRADGRWTPARPMDGPFLWRVKAAWGVLTGRYDALDWQESP